jgi:hypothetical protein
MIRQSLYAGALYTLSAFLAYAMTGGPGALSIALYAVIIGGSLRQIMGYAMPARFYGASIFFLILSTFFLVRVVRVSHDALVFLPFSLAAVAIAYILGLRYSRITNAGTDGLKE